MPPDPGAMQDPAKQKKLYGILSIVFTIAAVVWIISGFLTVPRHYLLFPLIGVLNYGVGWYCKQMSK
jgi:hypothetical protein